MLGRLVMLLLGALLILPAPAIAAWNEAKTRHFIIYSEQNAVDLKKYAERLERFDQAVRQARGMPDPALSDATRLTVYVLADQEKVASMAGAPGSGVAGFYIGRAAGPLTFVHRGKEGRSEWGLTAETVFFHEYFHHLSLEDLGNNALPAWITEGYAEFFGTAELLPDNSVRFGAVPRHRANGLFNLDAWGVNLSVEQMVGATYKDLTGPQWESIYGKGWLLTHFMTFEPARRGQITQYVNGIQQGKSALDSARSAFGDLKLLEREIQAYLNRKTLGATVIEASRITTGPIAIRPLGAGEAAIMATRMQTHRGVDKATAPRVAGEARRVAQRFPVDPVVQAWLAEAELDAKEHAAAIAAADRALAADPRNLKALLMRGKTMLEVAKLDRAKADWPAMRQYFMRANKVDPEAAEPLLMFYDSFIEAGQTPNASAVAGLMYAHQIVPQDSELRIKVTRQLLRENKLAEARKTYGPIAYAPHIRRKDEREKRDAIMAALIGGKGSVAASLLDAQQAEARKKAAS